MIVSQWDLLSPRIMLECFTIFSWSHHYYVTHDFACSLPVILTCKVVSEGEE